jgi:predicted ArsR family transcriptional regulator
VNEAGSSDEERKPGPEPSDDNIKLLKLIRLREEPFATKTDLVDDMEVEARQTRNRLDDLVEEGLLKVDMVGTTKVYWLSDEGKRQLADAVSSEE